MAVYGHRIMVRDTLTIFNMAITVTDITNLLQKEIVICQLQSLTSYVKLNS